MEVSTMRVQNFEHVNQFIITDKGNTFFQSYNSLIAKIDKNGKVTLYHDWDYSNTTLRHLYMFLREYSNIGTKYFYKRGIEKLIKNKVIKYINK